MFFFNKISNAFQTFSFLDFTNIFFFFLVSFNQFYEYFVCERLKNPQINIYHFNTFFACRFIFFFIDLVLKVVSSWLKIKARIHFVNKFDSTTSKWIFPYLHPGLIGFNHSYLLDRVNLFF